VSERHDEEHMPRETVTGTRQGRTQCVERCPAVIKYALWVNPKRVLTTSFVDLSNENSRVESLRHTGHL